MKIEKRIERLEKDYFPDSKLRGYLLHELMFLHVFLTKFEGHEDSAPAILRRAYHLLQKRPR